MTKEQAINDLIDYKVDHDLEIRDDAIDMAIQTLREKSFDMGCYSEDDKYHINLWRMILTEIEHVPSLDVQYYGDCIDKGEASKALRKLNDQVGDALDKIFHDAIHKVCTTPSLDPLYSDVILRCDVLDRLKSDIVDTMLASVKSNEKIGKWIEDDAGHFYCLNCHKYPKDQTSKTDFCPHCGSHNGG